MHAVGDIAAWLRQFKCLHFEWELTIQQEMAGITAPEILGLDRAKDVGASYLILQDSIKVVNQAKAQIGIKQLMTL